MVIRETLSHHFIFIYNFYIHNILSSSKSFFKKICCCTSNIFCFVHLKMPRDDSIIQQKKACVIIKIFCHRTLRQPCSYYFIAPDILLRKILHYHIRSWIILSSNFIIKCTKQKILKVQKFHKGLKMEG